MLEANKPESECIMKFSDEMFTDYGRRQDLLQQAEHVRLVRQAQRHSRDQPSFLPAVRRYLSRRVRQLNQRTRVPSRSKLPG